MKAKYSVVVPVFNEEQVIDESYKKLTETLNKLEDDYEIIFINDGSKDRTEKMLREICSKDKRIKLLNFSRNFGHQEAITAGMDYACGDAVIIIDADLQDPPEVMLRMIEEWKKGYEVVYGKRLNRKGETFFKKFSASVFYRLLKYMTSVDIPVDAGDFRLIDRKVCNEMKRLGERNRYVRGLVSWVGFKQTSVEYEREERFAGETKYPLKKMIKLALNGITSFSYKPLKFAISIGFTMSAFSFVYILVIIYQKIFTDTTIVGWASTIAVILLTQGIVLMILGIIGEYIGRIFDEIKGRPIYIVSEMVNFDDNDLKAGN